MAGELRTIVSAMATYCPLGFHSHVKRAKAAGASFHPAAQRPIHSAPSYLILSQTAIS